MEINYTVHIRNNDAWPAVDADGSYLGNYAEWEADAYEAENGELDAETSVAIDAAVERMTKRGFGGFRPGETVPMTYRFFRMQPVATSCRECHTTERPHRKNGLCDLCATRIRVEKARAKKRAENS